LSLDRADACAIAVMAKAPRVGNSKTRLMPFLSAEDAARISACFIRDAAENIAAAAAQVPIDGYIAHTPPGAAAEFSALLAPGTRLVPSRRPGLAASLHDAAADLLRMGYGGVCLINSDSPTLPTEFLADAARALARPGDRLVLGPAEDGGYYLIGMKRLHARLFEDIAWSTEAVFAQTIERAGEIGLEPVVLPGWYDIDDIRTLQRLWSEIATPGSPRPRPYPARHTAAFLHDFLRARDPAWLAAGQ